MRGWAGSGKLTKKQWEACRDATNYDKVAERLGVCRETVQRIAARRSWKYGWQPRRISDVEETKRCQVCDKKFNRRFANGRRRSPVMWEKKRTCSNSCNVVLMWREGVYANR